MINFNVSFSVLISFVKFVASMAEHDSDGDVVCDTSGYYLTGDHMQWSQLKRAVCSVSSRGQVT